MYRKLQTIELFNIKTGKLASYEITVKVGGAVPPLLLPISME